jgi:hypothetical protein
VAWHGRLDADTEVARETPAPGLRRQGLAAPGLPWWRITVLGRRRHEEGLVQKKQVKKYALLKKQ